MSLRNIAILFFVLGYSGLIAQKDSSRLHLSVLTCGAGSDLYALFGHSAIRIRDKDRDIDVVYNYGTFDFNTPGFGVKFLRGQLDYALSRTTMDGFMREYLRDKRWVKEQVLALSDEQEIQLLRALEENLKASNRYYKYDFFFDNCVTRIRDILELNLGSIQYSPEFDVELTFRQLLYTHTDRHPWTKFGMDLILGVRTDAIAGRRGQMFLPDYFYDYLQEATYEDGDLIETKRTLIAFPGVVEKEGFWTPQHFFMVLLILEIIVFFLFFVSGDEKFMMGLDIAWFGTLSLAFIVMLFMWIGTDHTVCSNNYNLLWTVPWSICALFLKRQRKKLMFFLTLLVSILLLVFWTMLPQMIPTVILFVLAITILKSLRHIGFVRWINRMWRAKAWTLIGVILLMGTSHIEGQETERITGITLVAPPRAFASDPMIDIKKVNAQWIALAPYAFSRSEQSPEVIWGSDRQWWGERIEGIETSIRLAKKNGLKVMLKPQVWIRRGWVGNMDFDSEEDWKIWEDSYRGYLMSFVDIAVKHKVDMICIGTEFRKCVVKREQFWRDLITDIRKKYDGRLTYSANWDSYKHMPFWDALDLIGISAYFPLTTMTTPLVLLLDYKWNKHVKKLRSFSKKHGKKILFTEYGYLSVDGAAGNTWELEKKVKQIPINERAQSNAYDALFGEFSDEDFWVGGFLWKWFPEGYGHEGYPERDYTPQNKLAEDVLRRWHEKLNNPNVSSY